MTQPENERMLVGALLEAPDYEAAKRITSTCGLTPGDFVDQMLRAAWRFALELIDKGLRPSAAAVFTEGNLAGLMPDSDKDRLIRLERGNELGDAEVVQIAKQIRQHATTKRVAKKLANLSAALDNGRDKDGNPFTHIEAQPHAEEILQGYLSAFADGRTAQEALMSVEANHQMRRADGKKLYTPSGFPVIDKELGGYPHKLCWVLGAQGAGKSSFLGTQIQLHAEMGLTTVLASLEDNDQWFVHRHVALGTGLKQRDVYSDAFPDEEKHLAVVEKLYNSWGKVWLYTKKHCRTASEIVRVFRQAIVQEHASVFYVDNLTGVKHTLEGRNDEPRRAAGRSIELFAEFADNFGAPLICVAHTNRAYWERTQGKAPPDISDTAETADAERYTRLGFSIWQKARELRVTVKKNNAQGATVGTTFAFDAHVDQGLIDVGSGRLVNLEAEQREEREERERKRKERVDKTYTEKIARESKRKAEVAAEREKEKAAKAMAKQEAAAAKKSPQPTLFDNGEVAPF